MLTVARALFVFVVVTGTLSARPDTWTQMKVGMTAQQTAALLGEPLLRSHGRGFETWTYDHGAEVLIYGGTAVVGWTAPAGRQGVAHSEDIWSNHPADDYYATMHAILPQPVKAAPHVRDEAPAASAGTGYEAYLRG